MPGGQLVRDTRLCTMSATSSPRQREAMLAPAGGWRAAMPPARPAPADEPVPRAQSLFARSLYALSPAAEPVPQQQAPPSHPKDCMECRVTGTVGMLGIATFLMFERRRIEASARGHRAAVTGLALVFASMGVYRGFIM